MFTYPRIFLQQAPPDILKQCAGLESKSEPHGFDLTNNSLAPQSGLQHTLGRRAHFNTNLWYNTILIPTHFNTNPIPILIPTRVNWQLTLPVHIDIAQRTILVFFSGTWCNIPLTACGSLQLVPEKIPINEACMIHAQ